MQVALEPEGQEVSVALTGDLDSRRCAPGAAASSLGRVESLVSIWRPRRLKLDFRGLSSIDRASFQEVVEVVAKLRRVVAVELLGPGPALERLFAVLRPPEDWIWAGAPAPQASASGTSPGVEPAAPAAPAGGLRGGGPGAGEAGAFEIDLDREQLFREGEPPGPEFDPMAGPLHLVGGWKQSFRGEEAQPPAPAAAGAGPGAAPWSGAPAPAPILEEGRGDAEMTALFLGDLDDLFAAGETGPAAAEAGERPSPPAFPPEPPPAWPRHRPRGVGVPDAADARLGARPHPARGDYEILKERLLEALLTEGTLRSRLAALEAENLSLRGMPASDAPPFPRPVPERPAPMPPGAPGPGRAGREAEPAAGDGRRDPIPQFLRSDVPRAGIIRAFGEVLERRRRGQRVDRAELYRIAAALAAAATRCPFAAFDLQEARGGAPAAAQAVHTTALAVVMALKAGAGRAGAETLALAGLLTALLGPEGERLLALPPGARGLRALALRLIPALASLASKAGGPAPPREAELEEGLELVRLAHEFWRRISTGPEGGREPAAAAASLARGEIAPGAPARLRRLFLETFSAFPPGTWVRLESGEVGVTVGPGTHDARKPLVLCLLAGGERELRSRQPRLVVAGSEPGTAVRAVVRPPIRSCPAPREVFRVATGAV